MRSCGRLLFADDRVACATTPGSRRARLATWSAISVCTANTSPSGRSQRSAQTWRAAAGVDQLRRDPHAVRLALDRALEHVPDAQFPPDLADVDRLALVDLGRVAGDHVELAETGQVGDHVLGDPVRQPAGRLVAAQLSNGSTAIAGFARRRLGRPEPPDCRRRNTSEQNHRRREPQRCSARGSARRASPAPRRRGRPGRSRPASLMFLTWCSPRREAEVELALDLVVTLPRHPDAAGSHRPRSGPRRSRRRRRWCRRRRSRRRG